MNNCNHHWISILTYPHPTKLSKKVVVYKCMLCGKCEVVHKFKGIIDLSNDIIYTKIKEKKLIKK